MSTNKLPTSCTLFTLPYELRLHIWQALLSTPRTVTMQIKTWHEMSDGNGTFEGCKSPEAVPEALQICQESREQALKHYKRCFAPGPNQRCIYFNFSTDTISIRDEDNDPYQNLSRLYAFLQVEYHDHTDIENIRCMIINLNYGRPQFYKGIRAANWMSRDLEPLISLNELKIVLWDEECSPDSCSVHRLYRRAVKNTLLDNYDRTPPWNPPNISVMCGRTGTVWRLEASEVRALERLDRP